MLQIYVCMYALFHPIHARSLKAALKITLRIWPTIEWNYPDGGKKNITQKFRTTTRKYNEVGCVSRNSIYVTQKKNYLKRDLFFFFCFMQRTQSYTVSWLKRKSTLCKICKCRWINLLHFMKYSVYKGKRNRFVWTCYIHLVWVYTQIKSSSLLCLTTDRH